MIIINTEGCKIIKVEQKGWYVKDISNFEGAALGLFIVKEVFYDHPDASGLATLPSLEDELYMKVKVGDKHYPAIFILYQAQINMSEVLKGVK